MSLDTHPANNALVVTYEISASVVDRSNQFEMTRRNKRDQLQINISALDNLTRDDLKADKLVINLKKLSEEIVNKCPMLLSDRHNLEDIQLHLLYLINRRQSQLLAENETASGGRPASGSLQRFRSAKGAQVRSSADYSRNDNLELDLSSNEPDVYNFLLTRETDKSLFNSLNHNELLNCFALSFDEHLTGLECRQSETNSSNNYFDIKADLEIHLENLYGNKAEKLAAMANLRELSKVNLSRMSSNRLLVCAMLRTLRDSDPRLELDLRQSIMFSLIKFTTYEDIYKRTFANDDQPIDLTKLIADLLFDQVRQLISIELTDNNNSLKLLSIDDNNYFYTTSLIIVMANLFRIDSCNNYQIVKFLLSHNQPQQHQQHQQQQQQPQPFRLTCLFELLQLITGQFIKELSLTTNRTLLLCTRRSIDLLNGLINILIQLSIFKEFIQQIRTSNTKLQLLVANSLINLMTVLQLTRPGSGKPSLHQRANTEYSLELQPSPLNDQKTLNKIYELEMKLMRLVNNLMLDQRIRFKLIKRNLLKCVLRNLVVFLASRKSNSLSSFHQSAVLMEPFRCLYELSCSNEIRLELYKSKIIIKCLLEYLLSSTIDLRSLLNNRLNLTAPTVNPNKIIDATNGEPSISGLDEIVDIVIEAKNAHYFIICLWVNLSAQSGSSIYGNDIQINQLVSEYIEASLNNLDTFITIIKTGKWLDLSWTNDELMLLYLHVKLLRNVSQFFGLNDITIDSELAEYFINWTERIGTIICDLVTFNKQIFLPIAVEYLAILGNFVSIGKTIVNKQSSAFTDQISNRWPSEKMLAQLLEKLFSLKFNNFEPAENDDLILVSVSLLAILARYCEICQLIKLEPKLSVKIIRASNNIFEIRMTDQQMILSSLYTLCQLTNHKAFLSELSSLARSSSDIEVGGSQLEQLVNKLAHLMLNGHQSQVAKLAGYLLIRLEQLDRLNSRCNSDEGAEEDEEDDQSERLVHTKRFSSYNSKWLAAIKASREDSSRTNSSGLVDNQQHDDDELYYDEYEETGDDQADDGRMARRRAISMRSQSQLLTSFADDLGAGQVKLFNAEELSEGSSGRTTAMSKRNGLLDVEHGSSSELDSDDEEPPEETGIDAARDDDDDNDEEEEEEEVDNDDDDDDDDGPDFNVVDANSMIKHLTSRREFRSKWLQH